MSHVGIVTDSTSDLPRELIDRYQIHVLPVEIVLDGATYRDGIDLSGQSFYKHFDTYSSIRSKPVSYEDYALKYKQLTNLYDELIMIHCSAELSETYAHAQRVHEDFGQTHACRVSIVDSRQCGLGLGLIVLEAAKAAQDGRSYTEIKQIVRRCLEATATLFGVPSLKYLRKGRKISGLKSLLGSAIRVKPILAIEGGSIVVKSKLFGEHKNMLLEMLQVIQEDVADHRISLGISHAEAPEQADELKQAMLDRFHCDEAIVSYVGPSIGLNTGPQATGIMYCKRPPSSPTGRSEN
jgi:DegV family protein with EDD domain